MLIKNQDCRFAKRRAYEGDTVKDVPYVEIDIHGKGDKFATVKTYDENV